MADDTQPIEEKNKGGRPEMWTQELGDKFCEFIAEGMSLRTACLQEGMPTPRIIYKWVREQAGFVQQYARACDDRADTMMEDIQDIADDGTNDWMEIERKDGSTFEVVNNEALQRSRLRIDTRKWIMAKVKPKKYGDKLDLTSDGKALPTPIYGGLSSSDTNRTTGPATVHVPRHDSDSEGVQPSQAN